MGGAGGDSAWLQQRAAQEENRRRLFLAKPMSTCSMFEVPSAPSTAGSTATARGRAGRTSEILRRQDAAEGGNEYAEGADGPEDDENSDNHLEYANGEETPGCIANRTGCLDPKNPDISCTYVAGEKAMTKAEELGSWLTDPAKQARTHDESTTHNRQRAHALADSCVQAFLQRKRISALPLCSNLPSSVRPFLPPSLRSHDFI